MPFPTSRQASPQTNRHLVSPYGGFNGHPAIVSVIFPYGRDPQLGPAQQTGRPTISSSMRTGSRGKNVDKGRTDRIFEPRDLLLLRYTRFSVITNSPSRMLMYIQAGSPRPSGTCRRKTLTHLYGLRPPRRLTHSVCITHLELFIRSGHEIPLLRITIGVKCEVADI